MKSSWLLCFFLAGILFLSAGLVRAQLIDVHFNNDSYGAGNGGPATGPDMSGAAVLGATGDQWNNINVTNGAGIPLIYANGSNSPATITFTSGGGYDVNAFGGSTPFAGTPYDALMECYLFTKGTSQTITLSNLAANSTYNLILYNAADVPAAGRTTYFTVNGNTQTNTWNGSSNTLIAGIDYVEFPSASSDASGKLVITWSGNGSLEGDINGFQIQTVPVTNSPATQWNIVWSDEFNGTSINTNNWTYDLGGGGWGNNELETYTSSSQNSYVSNGLLHIVALTNGSGYTAARMKTQGLQSWTYGRMEARIQIPRGQGIWPAFWMLGTNIVADGWPTCGEVDIMENIGNTSDQGTDHGTIHGPMENGQDYNYGDGVGSTYTLPGGAALADNFHIYGVEWTTNQITWFLDGNQFFTATPASLVGLPSPGIWVFTNRQFFILNIAVGGNWPGNPDATTVFPQQMLVDYVRVYQQTAPLAISVATQSNGSFILSWPTNIVCHLQVQTNSVAGGNWSDLPGATSPFVVTPASTQISVFYRLESP